ncbi:hypothetical protein ABEF92_001711 [Exophiala dermatitidis]|uniref:Uncharacterized protein n=1 Tax=Exophiala dermatitidis (strain ATCC 34100 / CBS 525.76 / NIH/UT8656) TaxID=858893 RepID=H6C2L5_EXODN|nr:uncharacterized protein HMPREF1120_05953 [Exophiala dermatitidis NIH/UT8656]EHY57933.1 hypothetical protein HMPREF1120_05953 [Exophiala dermatitidis NIH/UT8656]
MSPSNPAGPPSYKSSDMSPSEPTRQIHPMYVLDPETHTEALPYRPSHPTSLEKIYRRACCGSPGGILLWGLGLLAAIVVPIVVLYARGNLSHNAANPGPVAAAETTTPTSSTLISTVTDTAPASTPTPPSTTTSTFLTISTTTTTLTSISTDTAVSTETAITTETTVSVSVSTMTYSPPIPSTVMTTILVTTTATSTATTGTTAPTFVISVAESKDPAGATVTVKESPSSSASPSLVTSYSTTITTLSPSSSFHGVMTTRFLTPVTGPLLHPSNVDTATAHLDAGSREPEPVPSCFAGNCAKKQGPNKACSGSSTDMQCQQICRETEGCGDLTLLVWQDSKVCCEYCEC